MWVALSILVAAACALAAARRLAWAIAPVRVDLRVIGAEADSDPSLLADVGGAMASFPELTWERALWAALDLPDAPARNALINEQIVELEWLVDRWSRVPRVCASISTSTGFLFASMALMQGLSASDAASPIPDVTQAVSPALDALCVCFASASFCFAVHVRARRAVRDWLVAADGLVGRLRP